MDELAGVRVAFLVANEGVEQRELTEPWDAVRRAGGAPVLVAPDAGVVQCFEHLDRYVELELAGADADVAIPGMRAHLEGCPACHEDHESLRSFVSGEK